MELELREIGKAYGGTVALSSASLRVAAGSIHGIVGPNGAGKSTLVKVASGIVAPDRGEVVVDGQPIMLRRPGDALALGIVPMPQELTILPGLSVAENIVIGAEPSTGPVLWPWRRKAAAMKVLERLGIEMPLDAAAGSLSAPQQRLVMFANALHRQVRLLILDEPTAALSDAEAEVVIGAVLTLKRQGISVIYVSHRFREVLRLCDVVTVIRDGTSVASIPRVDLDLRQLVSAVIGKGALLDAQPRKGAPGEQVVVVDDLVGREVRGVSLAMRSGEILGIAGLSGSGVGDLLEMLGGVRRPRSGSIKIKGRQASLGCPADALALGLAYLPAERARSGFLDLTVRSNVVVSSLRRVGWLGVVTARWERKAIVETLDSLGIGSRIEDGLAALSGGNRQKALIARCLVADAEILVLDDPSAGVDVRARHDLHSLLRQLADKGRTVVVSSSEMEELAAVADRVLVFWRGYITAELAGAELTPDSVVVAATHGADAAVA